VYVNALPGYPRERRDVYDRLSGEFLSEEEYVLGHIPPLPAELWDPASPVEADDGTSVV